MPHCIASQSYHCKKYAISIFTSAWPPSVNTPYTTDKRFQLYYLLYLEYKHLLYLSACYQGTFASLTDEYDISNMKRWMSQPEAFLLSRFKEKIQNIRMAIILHSMNCLFCMGFAYTYTYFQRCDYLSWYLFILTSNAQKQHNTGTLSAKHTLDRPTINHSSVCNPVVHFRSLQYTIWSVLPKYKWPLLLADITASWSISDYTGNGRPKHQGTKCDLFLITTIPQSFTTLAIFIASSYTCTCILIIGIET